jgi:hypothetical protein
MIYYFCPQINNYDKNEKVKYIMDDSFGMGIGLPVM